MKALLFFVIIGLVTPLSAQMLTNDFSNPDLSEWIGDTAKFTVSEGQLQLNDTNPGSSNTSYISIAAPTSSNLTTTWETWVQLDFAPSSSNFSRIYLTASSPDLSGNLNGYYLKIGGISGSDDAIELFRQDGSGSTLLLSGSTGAVGSAPALANINVTRTEAGLWQLQVDYSGGLDFQFEGEASDDTYPMGNYFGYYCRYSASRANAFSFDNLLINPLFEDETPPVLLSAEPIDQNTLAVLFDEAINPESATDPSLFNLSTGLNQPSTAVRSTENPATVILTWSQAFINLTTYTLTTNGVADEAGNASSSQSVEFTYLDLSFPQAGDLIITELMVDPSPPLGLPNAEYIELLNISEKVLELEEIGISTGSSPKKLPSYQLLPGAYVLLVDSDDLASFSSVSNILGIEGLPAMTNSGDQVSLTDKDGGALVELNYDLSWYAKPERSNGGWSLELIQTDQVLDCPGNWAASDAQIGGTPGELNSINGQALETEGPILLSAFVESETEIVLVFDESLDFASASAPEAYSITGGIGIEFAFPQPGNQQVLLNLDSPLQSGTVYEVQATTSIKDCLDNPITSPVSRRVGLAVPAEKGDIVINELLFFPEVGGEDFVELYNRSDKTINLLDWRIDNLQADGSNRSEIIERDFLIFPGEYVVITEVAQDILDRYTVNFPERLLENPLPTISSEGTLSFTTPAFVVVDSFAYSDDLHSPLLDDERGVSLERVDADAPTNSPGNWHSAAGTVGFATPTDENSQFLPVQAAGSNVINLVQKRFSPDGDGFEDLLLLEVETDRPGYLASIEIFDANGRLTRRLLRNELLPTEGVFKWDGTHEDGRRARIGIYVLWIELVNPDGTVERWKESFVVAGKLE